MIGDKKTTIVIADDHAMVRDTLAGWLTGVPDFQILAVVKDGDAAISAAVRSQPDIVVLDIDMPGIQAFDAAKTIKIRSASTKIIFLSAFCHDSYIEQALLAGALAYVTKSEAPGSLENAIRAVAAGGVYFSPDVQSRIIVDVDGPRLTQGAIRTRTSTLTARELEVLRYLSSGRSKKEIADTMTLSVGTVNNHAANLMRKLDIHDRVELTRFAIREGLIDA